MSEAVKKIFGRLPETVRNGALVFVILLLAFGASCGGTFAIFAGSFMRETDWIVVSFGWLFLALGPIGFFWFFFKKLGFAEGFKWVAELAGILVAYGISWIITVSTFGNMTRFTYFFNGFGDFFEFKHPAYVIFTTVLFLIEFALFCLAMNFAGKRFAERRKKYVRRCGERTNESSRTESASIFSPQE